MNDDMHNMIDKASKAPTDRRALPRKGRGRSRRRGGSRPVPRQGPGFGQRQAPRRIFPPASPARGRGRRRGRDQPVRHGRRLDGRAVIFDGGYGTDYVQFAADLFGKVHEGSTAEVSPSTQIASELQPRFVSGNPPD